tara:strand:+ start:136 stop:516 length:381 start_codon:yes stop_codon:yes gene_type:complete
MEYSNFIIKKTSVWGDHYKSRNGNNKLRLMKKLKILQCYPFINHYTKYAFKPKSQKGPAKESQTFILSYAYNYDNFIENKENEFINKLNNLNLRFYKERCMFREKDAYKILIMDTDIDLLTILQLL